MSWYKEYRSQWKEIIETVARELGRTELMVEKDTIQSDYDYALENGIAIVARSNIFEYKKKKCNY